MRMIPHINVATRVINSPWTFVDRSKVDLHLWTAVRRYRLSSCRSSCRRPLRTPLERDPSCPLRSLNNVGMIPRVVIFAEIGSRMKEDVSPPEVVCELGYVTDVSYNNASRCISEFPARLSLDLA